MRGLQKMGRLNVPVRLIFFANCGRRRRYPLTLDLFKDCICLINMEVNHALIQMDYESFVRDETIKRAFV